MIGMICVCINKTGIDKDSTVNGEGLKRMMILSTVFDSSLSIVMIRIV